MKIISKSNEVLSTIASKTFQSRSFKKNVLQVVAVVVYTLLQAHSKISQNPVKRICQAFKLIVTLIANTP